ncbi:hypothetical protein POF45_26915 [Pseudomonas sp. 681]|uniref:Dit-like phage tail protein N-terminal domain-containing protein n=1 Tax=Pseudomonas fungipugnans TaxID=3024217 RepID=A0ABT6QW97_9PSED|nr:hypothetical protein [Pseudomonas sp. 681]MDI2595026.1 hypothetical protein [Pseudomonas sp. 681]
MPNFAGFITIDPKRSIDTIVAHVTLEEVGTDELQITEHPVELGANITDHAFKKPADLVIRCGWSNASLAGVLNGVQGLISALSGGDAFGSDYVSSVYNQLLALQESRIPFDVSTGKRLYSNMLMRSLGVTTDEKSEYTLMVTAVFKQILIVQTQATTLPPRDDQAQPEATAETADTGTKQVVVGVPAPGGWQPPNG